MPTVNELIRNTELTDRDKLAHDAGFLSLVPGEVYERQYSKTSHVFLMVDNEKWSAWRETWQGKLQSITHKDIVDKVPFEIALQQANNYIKFILKKRG